jgi:hypothetical protein
MQQWSLPLTLCDCYIPHLLAVGVEGDADVSQQQNLSPPQSEVRTQSVSCLIALTMPFYLLLLQGGGGGMQAQYSAICPLSRLIKAEKPVMTILQYCSGGASAHTASITPLHQPPHCCDVLLPAYLPQPAWMQLNRQTVMGFKSVCMGGRSPLISCLI